MELKVGMILYPIREQSRRMKILAEPTANSSSWSVVFDTGMRTTYSSYILKKYYRDEPTEGYLANLDSGHGGG